MPEKALQTQIILRAGEAAVLTAGHMARQRIIFNLAA
jgi:hypothetical protein